VGNIEEMSRHALEILSDEAVLQKFRHQASEHAKKFDIHNIVPQYEALYNQFL
jgi:L-malate glycosyltransferase